MNVQISDPIVVNLLQRSDRWDSLVEAHRGFDFRFRRVDAIVGGVQAIAQSHAMALESAWRQPSHPWICEDDVRLDKDARERLNFAVEELESANIPWDGFLGKTAVR